MARKKSLEKEQYWQELVNRQSGSGLSIRQFCAKERISQPSFYAWRKKFRERRDDGRASKGCRVAPTGDGGFIPLKLGTPASALEVIHPLGFQVRVTGEVNTDALRQVLDVLDGRAKR